MEPESSSTSINTKELSGSRWSKCATTSRRATRCPKARRCLHRQERFSRSRRRARHTTRGSRRIQTASRRAAIIDGIDLICFFVLPFCWTSTVVPPPPLYILGFPPHARCALCALAPSPFSRIPLDENTNLRIGGPAQALAFGTRAESPCALPIVNALQPLPKCSFPSHSLLASSAQSSTSRADVMPRPKPSVIRQQCRDAASKLDVRPLCVVPFACIQS